VAKKKKKEEVEKHQPISTQILVALKLGIYHQTGYSR
jgi:hypothetical protein